MNFLMRTMLSGKSLAMSADILSFIENSSNSCILIVNLKFFTVETYNLNKWKNKIIIL